MALKQRPEITVTQYLASVPDDRRAAIKTLRALVNKHLPKGYEEGTGFGMIVWSVPLTVYPDTYNGQPLMYAALASQKNYMALYLTGGGTDGPVHKKLIAGFKAAGKKLDVGKSCIRFKQLDDLALDVIAEAIATVPVKAHVEAAKQARAKKK
jgi:hypothetical protein